MSNDAGNPRRSLRECKTLEDISLLKRDNYSCESYWIIADEREVTIREQRAGHESTARIRIPRRQFNAMIDFYQRDQDAD